MDERLSLDFRTDARKACDMGQSVKDFAAENGISVQRVRELARKGAINASFVDGAWSIAEPPGQRTPRRRRPLSRASQDALIRFLDTNSLRHVQGHAKDRLAAKLQALQQSENPAALLREYFADRTDLDGVGGIAMVRSALKGNDSQVRDGLCVTPKRVLNGIDSVSDALRTLRSISGLSAESISTGAGISISSYRRLESGTSTPNANLIAAKAFHVMGYSPSRIRTGSHEEVIA